MKSKILLIFILFLFVINLVSAKQLLHDNADLLTNDAEIESALQNIYNYEAYGATVEVYTVNTDEEVQDLYLNGFFRDKLDISSGINLNAIVIFKEGYEYPAIVFSTLSCGYDKMEISYILNNEFISFEDLPSNSEIFSSVTDPDGETKYTLGVSALINEKNYDGAILKFVQFLDSQVRLVIKPNSESLKYKFCPTKIENPNEEIIISEEKPKAREIDPIIVDRLKKIKSAVTDATKKYPRVPKNLELAKIAAESGGVVNAVSLTLTDGTRAGDYGLTQLNPCTAKELGIIKRVDCAQWRTTTLRVNPCDSSQCYFRKITLSEDLTNIFNARKNVFAGTKYLNDRLKDCSYISDKYDRYRCALASYNAGYGSVRRAISKADSTAFTDYSKRLPNPHITTPYVEKIIGYTVWLDENPTAV